MAGELRRAGARRGRRGARPLPGRRARRHPLRAAVRLHLRLRAARAQRAARRLRHDRGRDRDRAHRDRVRRGRLSARRAVRDHASEPGARGRDLRRARRPTSRAGRSRRPTRTSSRPCARPAGCCDPRSTSTPIRTAGAAARRSSTTRRRAGTSGRPRSATDAGRERDHRLAPRARQARPLRPLAEGNVDWALSRERYWGTPLPIWECTSADCEGSFCAGSIAELRERAGEVPDDLHRPYIDEVVAAVRRLRWGDAPRRGGDRRLVRLGRDAVRAVSLPVRGHGRVRAAVPGRLHLRGDDQTRGLVLLAARRVSSCCSIRRATAIASAWA